MSKSVSSFLCVCAVAMTGISLCDNVHAQTTEPCTYTPFKYPGTMTVSTAANGINEYGKIVGTAQDQTGTVFGFIRYSKEVSSATLYPDRTIPSSSVATPLVRLLASTRPPAPAGNMACC